MVKVWGGKVWVEFEIYLEGLVFMCDLFLSNKDV